MSENYLFTGRYVFIIQRSLHFGLCDTISLRNDRKYIVLDHSFIKTATMCQTHEMIKSHQVFIKTSQKNVRIHLTIYVSDSRKNCTIKFTKYTMNIENPQALEYITQNIGLLDEMHCRCNPKVYRHEIASTINYWASRSEKNIEFKQNEK